MVDSKSEVFAVPTVIRSPQNGLTIQERGVFTFEVRNADGELTQTAVATNALTTVGANKILDNWRSTSAGSSSLFIGLINGATSPTLATSDTMASHTGWTEATWTSSSSYARQAWNPGAASNGQMTASSGTFTLSNVSSNVVVAGAFLTDAASASGASDTLFATSQFTGNSTLTLGVNDTLTISFNISLS